MALNLQLADLRIGIQLQDWNKFKERSTSHQGYYDIFAGK